MKRRFMGFSSFLDSSRIQKEAEFRNENPGRRESRPDGGSEEGGGREEKRGRGKPNRDGGSYSVMYSSQVVSIPATAS